MYPPSMHTTRRPSEICPAPKIGGRARGRARIGVCNISISTRPNRSNCIALIRLRTSAFTGHIQNAKSLPMVRNALHLARRLRTDINWRVRNAIGRSIIKLIAHSVRMVARYSHMKTRRDIDASRAMIERRVAISPTPQTTGPDWKPGRIPHRCGTF